MSILEDTVKMSDINLHLLTIAKIWKLLSTGKCIKKLNKYYSAIKKE